MERLVAAIHHAQSKGALVTWNDEIDGRQFDVTIRFKFGLHDYLTVIECKDYSSKVSVEKVDALVTKARDVRANKTILVSSHGFQSGCFPVAERHGIQLLVLSETTTTTVPELIHRLIPGLNVYDVHLVSSVSAETFELEDWGGKLAYLMDHATLTYAGGQTTLGLLLQEWQLTQPDLHPETENHAEIPLPPGSVYSAPHEAAIPVRSLRFTCKFVELAIPKHPLPDNHILQAIQTRVELRDTDGVVRHSSALGDIPLGFDGQVQPGHFYEQPNLYNRYYCDSITGELIRWYLVESYQHGQLIQSIFTQKTKYSRHYVEVTEKTVLVRLQEMLADMKKRR